MRIYDNDFEQLYDELGECVLQKLASKHILIAGATGMLARYTTRFLLYLNQYKHMHMELYVLARNAEKLRHIFEDAIDLPYVHSIIQDVCNPIALRTPLDYIIHAAGPADPKTIVSNPVSILKANTLGTIQLCELAKQKQAHILFLSTREIYGRTDINVLNLDEMSYGVIDCLNSRSCYPESKKCAETILKSYAQEFGVSFTSARIAHSYGPGMAIDNDGRIMADMMHDFVYKKDFVLKSDGQMKRAFCYISDAVKALILIMVNGKSQEAYNVANETEEIKVIDLANIMAKMAGTNVVFEEQSDAEKQGYLQIPRVSLNTKKIEELGWKPTISLQDGILRTWKSFQN